MALSQPAPSLDTMSSKRVRLIDGPDGILAVLEIKACNQPSLLRTITDLLFALRVQIVRFESSVRGKLVAARLFVVEFDGGRIDAARRLQIQTAILGELDRVGPGLYARPRIVRLHGDRAKPAISRAV